MNFAAMNQFSESRVAFNLKWMLPFLGLLFIIVHYWKKRKLYYYALKFPGPFGFPLFGSIHLLKDGPGGKLLR
jgi:hypothetical protein